MLPVGFAWLGLVAGVLVALAAGLIPVAAPFGRPDRLFAAVSEGQMFFAAFLWPLFLPSLLRNFSATAVAAAIPVLGAVALPLVLVAANLSEATGAALAGSQLLWMAWAAFVASLYGAGARAVGPWYFLAMLLVSALPVFASAVVSAAPGESIPGGAYLSPFWGLLYAGRGPDFVQAGAAALLAGGLAAARRFRRAP